MSIKVNITRINRALPINEAGLTLAFVPELVARDGFNFPLRLNSIADLKARLEVPEEDDGDGNMVPVPEAMYQWYSLEYLLASGANLIVTDESDKLKDIFDEYEYKQIVAPYTLAKLGEGDGELPTDVINLVKAVEDPRITAQLYLDLDPTKDSDEYLNVINKLRGIKDDNGDDAKLAKVELCANFGMPVLQSEQPLPVFGAEYFYGVGASMALAARKAKALLNGLPWFPIAGETNGAVPELTQLYNAYTNKEKEDIQTLNINLLMNKVGFGPLFVSQNTQFVNIPNNPTEPLLRSHVVTQALWIKRELDRLAGPIEFMPNNTRYQLELETSIRKFLRDVFDKDGLEEPAYVKVTGSGNTMTGVIEYIPIKATESIVLNVAIIDNTGEIDIMLDGGNL